MRVIPAKVLRETMQDELVYNALKGGGFIRNLPAYVDGSYYFTDACVEEIESIPSAIQRDIIWDALYEAHETWRNQPEILKLIFYDDCNNCLNVFLRLELAGVDVYMLWARKFARLFKLAGFDLSDPLDPGEFDQQISWISDIDCMFPRALAEIYLANRRRFAEDAELIGKRDLYQYLTSTKNDVLNACSWQEYDGHEHRLLKGKLRQALYSDGDDNLSFRLTRQTILANGGGAPVEW